MTVDEAFATMPARIKVGSVIYRIAVLDAVAIDNALACIDPDRETIEIMREAASAAGLAARLLHELFHAIWTDRQLGRRPNEEKVVSQFEAGTVALLRDNPNLLAWITRALS